MDKLAKALAKMPVKDCAKINQIIIRIKNNDYSGLDFKKLSGHNDIFRVRWGDWRIIFSLANNETVILAVEKRSDNTYNF